MAIAWYVVHTYSGHENKVKESLDKAIKTLKLEESFGQILVATEKHAEMRNGKRTTVERKTFPSYVLIEMDLNEETKSLVMSVPGVTRFLSTGTRPSELRETDVKRVLGQMDPGKTATSVPFKLGEHVKVVDGPFSNFSGVVDEINAERGKLKVMVSIFGRGTPVELDFLQVKPI